MSLLRNFPLALFSLLSGFALAWLFTGFVSSGSDSGEGWGIVSFDEKEDDRRIGEILAACGFGNFYSESNQVVYIDDFGGLKKAPLDRFEEFLEPYDPRNDGYAEKLRLVFVREGKRYFFVPFAGAGNRTKLENALGGIPFEIELLVKKKNVTLNLIFGAVSLFAAFFLSRDKRRFALQIPVLLAFAQTGFEGLVLAGFLTGLRTILPDLWIEFLPRRGTPSGVEPSGSFWERLKPYRLHFLFIFLFLFFSGLICVLDSVLLPAAGVGFAFFFLLEFLGLRAERRNTERIRFTAVWMLTKKVKIPVFRGPLIPFAAAVPVLFLVPVFLPEFAARAGEPPFFMDDYVSLKDYEDHLDFQLSFSQKALGRSEGPRLEYYLASDGLIAAVPEPAKPAETVPPFPLEKLRTFLIEYSEGIKTKSFIPVEWVSALLLAALFALSFYRQGKVYGGKKKTVLFWDRQAAA